MIFTDVDIGVVISVLGGLAATTRLYEFGKGCWNDFKKKPEHFS